MFKPCHSGFGILAPPSEVGMVFLFSLLVFLFGLCICSRGCQGLLRPKGFEIKSCSNTAKALGTEKWKCPGVWASSMLRLLSLS